MGINVKALPTPKAIWAAVKTPSNILTPILILSKKRYILFIALTNLFFRSISLFNSSKLAGHVTLISPKFFFTASEAFEIPNDANWVKLQGVKPF